MIRGYPAELVADDEYPKSPQLECALQAHSGCGLFAVVQAAGALQPDYEVVGQETYHFVAEDGSTFIVERGGWFSDAKRKFVAGPSKGRSETITAAQVEQYEKLAEKEWGKYIPGSLIREPRFIPGTKRSELPLSEYREGARYIVGWIDADGVHYFPGGKGYL